jgi:hypothetical protein
MTMFNRSFGVEIEAYLPVGTTAAELADAISARGVDCRYESYNHGLRSYWKLVTDGSLGDMTRGIEAVAPPITGPAGIAAMRTVLSAMEDFGCSVGRKCGLHVHVGVGAPAIGFFRNLLKMYQFFEPVIDRCMPSSRRASANGYCRSVTHIQPAKIDAAPSLDKLLRLFGTLSHEQRYYKLNLRAYERYRTVEFRQHAGTLSGDKAAFWVQLCLRMVERAFGGPLHVGSTVGAVQVGAGPVNSQTPGTKAWQLAELMLRPDGVSGPEAIAAMGWVGISLSQEVRRMGIPYTTLRTGRVVRYYAQAAAVASAPVTPTLAGMFGALGCDADEQAYFAARTQNLSGTTAWAA